MFLEQRWNVFRPANMQGIAALGTTQRWSIDRTWPIEEILIDIYFECTAITLPVIGAATRTTMDLNDGPLALLQRINLSVNDGRQPRSVVDTSGMRLLEFCSRAGWNIDADTWRTWRHSRTSGIAALPAGGYHIFYRIPMADPGIGEPLRTRMYLPCHTYPQDPVLSLTYNTLAGTCSGAPVGAYTQLNTTITLIRREVTAASENLLRSTPGSNPTGYIDWDLIESQFQVPALSAAELRAPIPVPGNYVNLLMSQYRGAAAGFTKDIIDANLGALNATGAGADTIWRIESGQVIKRQWTWAALAAFNGGTQPQTDLGVQDQAIGTIVPGGVQDFNGPKAATSYFTSPCVTMHNFLTDGVTGDTGNELGSLLDCNTPVVSGLRMEICGLPVSTANGSMLCILGRRLFGDISRWQKF